jgi:choice-of-anchor A domain-containing protein
MRVSPRLASIAAGLALACAGASQAAGLPESADAQSVNAGFQAMRDYNLIVLKDLQSSSEVEGRAFVGGNLSGGSSNYFTSPNGLSGGTGLTVAGNVTGSAKQINNGAALKVGGNLDSGANMNGAGQVYVDGGARNVNASNAAVYVDGDVKNINAHDVYYGGSASGYVNGTRHAGDHTAGGLQTTLQAQAAAYTEDLLDTSAYLAALAPTNTLTYSANGQQAIFDAGTGAGVAVFAIGDLYAALNHRSQLSFTFPATYDLVVVNVAGTNVTLPGGINFNTATNLGQKVIWNFYEATSANFGAKSWYGSVLAPNADLKINNFIEGSVVAKSLLQNGEIHMNNFAAGAVVNDMRAAVPEPATWATMILGFGAIGAVLRRRRAVAA